ncbi:hypothetical protein LOAG_11622 [Loa loa]|uniref:Uncharacterized protein n=1 Tax=Loa loa TaxID=7209 RepID=A0A1S0TMQ2_LOALO|nr:hypothetical protein LOAG_11622 [Loa loa]EFO16880.1 hypothetical protein LOAG_11622 [Loa loa]
MCEQNERIIGLDVIQNYYQYDLLDQLRILIDSSTEHLYPLMCRFYLPIQYHSEVNRFIPSIYYKNELLTNETSNEIKQSILTIKHAVLLLYLTKLIPFNIVKLINY